MNVENEKCVIIVDENLPLGIIANTAAILGITMGMKMPDVVGKDVIDSDGNPHMGIIQFPVPILKGNTEILKSILNHGHLLFEGTLDQLKFSAASQGYPTDNLEDTFLALIDADNGQRGGVFHPFAVWQLCYTSIVLLEQLRTVDKRRLGDFIGHLSEKHIHGINHALAVSIGLIESVPKKLILCLCSACADNFYGTGVYSLRRIDPQQTEKDTCTYCNQRKGYDYEIIPKNR